MLDMKSFLGMAKVRDDISLVYGSSVSKCIKCGVGVIFIGNVGWYVGMNFVDIVDRYVVGKVGSDDDGLAKI